MDYEKIIKKLENVDNSIDKQKTILKNLKKQRKQLKKTRRSLLKNADRLKLVADLDGQIKELMRA